MSRREFFCWVILALLFGFCVGRVSRSESHGSAPGVTKDRMVIIRPDPNDPNRVITHRLKVVHAMRDNGNGTITRDPLPPESDLPAGWVVTVDNNQYIGVPDR